MAKRTPCGNSISKLWFGGALPGPGAALEWSGTNEGRSGHARHELTPGLEERDQALRLTAGTRLAVRRA